MSSDEALRKSLDAIDAMRQRMYRAGYVAVAGTLAAFYWLTHLARTPQQVNAVIVAAVVALTCVIAWSTFALALIIVRATKRILLAIELAGRTGR